MTDQPDPQWAIAAARAAEDKSGTDIVVLDVGPVLSICQYFVLVSANNTRLVKTIAEEVEEQVVAAGGPKPIRVEGLGDLGWVLLDYGDMVVHVFLDDQRSYYDLDRLWARPKVTLPYGAIAQLVERFHGMEEVRSSILLSSTKRPGVWHLPDAWAFLLGGGPA